MTRRRPSPLALACVLLALGAALAAQNSNPAPAAAPAALDYGAVITSIDRPTVAALLKEEGYQPTLVKEKTIKFKLQGYTCYVMVNPGDVQVYSWFDGPADQDKVNQFNADFRFGKAYWDEENDVCLQADLDVEGGVTLGAIKAWIEVFGDLLDRYDSL